MSKHVDPKAVEATSTAVVEIEDITIEKAPTIYGKGILSQFVASVRAKVIGEVPDLTTDKGRKRIASLAAQVARSKTAVDGVGREYLKMLKEQPKVIEAELRNFLTDMDALRDEVRAPLNEYEAKELARKDAIEDAVQAIVDLYTLPEDCHSRDIRLRIAQLENRVPSAEVFAERLEEAQQKREHGITTLMAALTKRVTQEEEAAELERLRQEAAARAERDCIAEAQRQAVEQERQRVAQEEEARRQAEAQRLADAERQAQQAEIQRQQAEQRAEQARQDAANQAAQAAEQARQDEQRRQQEEQAEQERQAAARAADIAHRGAINKAALEALLAVSLNGQAGDQASYMSVTEAKAVIAAIVRGQIPAVSIQY